MSTILYSVVPDEYGRCERQWLRSIVSLRRHNPDQDVVIAIFGALGDDAMAAAAAAQVEVVPMGDYPAALGDIPDHWRASLATHPTLHKLISLSAVSDRPGPFLYVDCDTYFRGDVARLVERHGRCLWHSREEPNSSRSQYGYDPSYVDEPLLAEVARAEGLVPIPPYQTGVFLVAASIARALARLIDEFVWYAWRLLLGACLWRPAVVVPEWLPVFIQGRAGAGERRLALPYPSSNGWILEEVASWLILGRLPGLTHGLLRREDVAQGSEHAEHRHWTLAHYYSGGERAFLDALAARGEL